ncbi:MAG: hypothetical protein WAM60_17950, partial [Candidatus Promineifilaceae bacterium]
MFRRSQFLVVCLAFILLTACSGNKGGPVPTNSPVSYITPATTPATPVQVTAVPTDTLEPTAIETPTAVDSPTAAPAPSDTPFSNLSDLNITPGGVTLLPAPKIYEGDQVTFQISPNIPEGMSFNDVRVQIMV